MTAHTYSADFFRRHAGGAISSARAIVPSVVELVEPKSVVDVGCGVGAWLSVFLEYGVTDVVGIDGPYVSTSQLLIPHECFINHDLEQPIALTRRFDLAVSLEVAEHVSPAAADTFANSLARLAPAILFSAAIPRQGGEHHVNEQWPQFWAEKFRREGFIAIDCVRPRVWNDTAVDWWYAQNTFLYVREELAARSKRIEAAAAASSTPLAPVIHPGQYSALAWRAQALSVVENLFNVVPIGAAIALVDDYAVCDGVLRAWRTRRLMETDGVDYGPPASAEAAVAQVEKHRREGTSFVVIAFSAFWWLEHYTALAACLRSSARCVLENDNLIVFDLGRKPQQPAD